MGNKASKLPTLQIIKVTENSMSHKSDILPFFHTILQVNDKDVVESIDGLEIMKIWESSDLSLLIRDLRVGENFVLNIKQKSDNTRLGLNVKYIDNVIDLFTIKILKVIEGSYAQKCGLMKYDYILGIENVSCESESKLLKYIENKKKQGMNMIVFNEKMNIIRKVFFKVDSGLSLYGCVIGLGILYGMPKDHRKIQMVFDEGVIKQKIDEFKQKYKDEDSTEECADNQNVVVFDQNKSTDTMENACLSNVSIDGDMDSDRHSLSPQETDTGKERDQMESSEKALQDILSTVQHNDVNQQKSSIDVGELTEGTKYNDDEKRNKEEQDANKDRKKTYNTLGVQSNSLDIENTRQLIAHDAVEDVTVDQKVDNNSVNNVQADESSPTVSDANTATCHIPSDKSLTKEHDSTNSAEKQNEKCTIAQDIDMALASNDDMKANESIKDNYNLDSKMHNSKKSIRACQEADVAESATDLSMEGRENIVANDEDGEFLEQTSRNTNTNDNADSIQLPNQKTSRNANTVDNADSVKLPNQTSVGDNTNDSADGVEPRINTQTESADFVTLQNDEENRQILNNMKSLRERDESGSLDVIEDIHAQESDSKNDAKQPARGINTFTPNERQDETVNGDGNSPESSSNACSEQQVDTVSADALRMHVENDNTNSVEKSREGKLHEDHESHDHVLNQSASPNKDEDLIESKYKHKNVADTKATEMLQENSHFIDEHGVIQTKFKDTDHTVEQSASFADEKALSVNDKETRLAKGICKNADDSGLQSHIKKQSTTDYIGLNGTEPNLTKSESCNEAAICALENSSIINTSHSVNILDSVNIEDGSNTVLHGSIINDNERTIDRQQHSNVKCQNRYTGEFEDIPSKTSQNNFARMSNDSMLSVRSDIIHVNDEQLEKKEEDVSFTSNVALQNQEDTSIGSILVDEAESKSLQSNETVATTNNPTAKDVSAASFEQRHPPIALSKSLGISSLIVNVPETDKIENPPENPLPGKDDTTFDYINEKTVHDDIDGKTYMVDQIQGQAASTQINEGMHKSSKEYTGSIGNTNTEAVDKSFKQASAFVTHIENTTVAQQKSKERSTFGDRLATNKHMLNINDISEDADYISNTTRNGLIDNDHGSNAEAQKDVFIDMHVKDTYNNRPEDVLNYENNEAVSATSNEPSIHYDNVQSPCITPQDAIEDSDMLLQQDQSVHLSDASSKSGSNTQFEGVLRTEDTGNMISTIQRTNDNFKCQSDNLKYNDSILHVASNASDEIADICTSFSSTARSRIVAPHEPCMTNQVSHDDVMTQESILEIPVTRQEDHLQSVTQAINTNDQQTLENRLLTKNQTAEEKIASTIHATVISIPAKHIDEPAVKQDVESDANTKLLDTNILPEESFIQQNRFSVEPDTDKDIVLDESLPDIDEKDVMNTLANVKESNVQDTQNKLKSTIAQVNDYARQDTTNDTRNAYSSRINIVTANDVSSASSHESYTSKNHLYTDTTCRHDTVNLSQEFVEASQQLDNGYASKMSPTANALDLCLLPSHFTEPAIVDEQNAEQDDVLCAHKSSHRLNDAVISATDASEEYDSFYDNLNHDGSSKVIHTEYEVGTENADTTVINENASCPRTLEQSEAEKETVDTNSQDVYKSVISTSFINTDEDGMKTCNDPPQKEGFVNEIINRIMEECPGVKQDMETSYASNTNESTAYAQEDTKEHIDDL